MCLAICCYADTDVRRGRVYDNHCLRPIPDSQEIADVIGYTDIVY